MFRGLFWAMCKRDCRKGGRKLLCEPVKNVNPVWMRVGAACAALLAVGGAGCGAARKGDAVPEAKTVLDHFTIPVGAHPASLQVAVLAPEQERGLMQRPDLGRDEGMIFVN